jgi:mannose-6-phosphate isomerase class I
LHIEEALQCIDFARGPISPLAPRSLNTDAGLSEELIQTEHFVWRRHTLKQSRCRLPDDDRCRILSLIEGDARIVCSSGQEPLTAGESLVIPADCVSVSIEAEPKAVLLDTLSM